MLMITTTVRLGVVYVRAENVSKSVITYMIHWVHCNTTGLGPGVSLDRELMFGTRRL